MLSKQLGRLAVVLVLGGGGLLLNCRAARASVASDSANQAMSLALLPRLEGAPWMGTSTCVGNRPACKNETVVYRFVAIEGRLDQIRLLADKILEGKRVPMGALVFEIDEKNGRLRSEFQVGRTHGVWSFKVSGDKITGTLVILPEGSKARNVTVHRTNVLNVPEAPPDSLYLE